MVARAAQGMLREGTPTKTHLQGLQLMAYIDCIMKTTFRQKQKQNER